MIFHQLFEQESSTYTYLLADEDTKEAILIDAVLETAERDLKLITELGLKLKYLLDTHIHADHITGAGTLRAKTGAKTAVSSGANVQCVDVTLNDGDELKFGKYTLKALSTPGHTNSCMTFYTEGMLLQVMSFLSEAPAVLISSKVILEKCITVFMISFLLIRKEQRFTRAMTTKECPTLLLEMKKNSIQESAVENQKMNLYKS